MVTAQTKRGIPKNKGAQVDMVIAISFSLYILTTFTAITPFLTNYLNRGSLYLFLGLSSLRLISNFSSFRLTFYNIWLLILIFFGLISGFYAIDDSYVFDDIYQLAIIWILTFFAIKFVKNYKSFIVLISCYAYSSAILSLYLLLSGETITFGGRLGQEQFGNANNLAVLMMISLLCLFWLILYGNKKYVLIHIFVAILSLYITALTGGRKYFLIPFVFFLLLIIFKYFRQNRYKGLVYLCLLFLFVYISISAVANIPQLHDGIGTRFEGLFSFVNGDLSDSDYSTIMRYEMINSGLNFISKNPIFGYGLNNFRALFSRAYYYDTYAHNNFIELLVDLGVLGFVVYYLYYGVTLYKLARMKNNSTGIRNFFLAFILIALIFEVGAVTYSLIQIQIFLSLASTAIFIKNDNSNEVYDE